MQATTAEAPASENRSLTLIAFDRVREDVIQGTLGPGERLRVQALSSRYGTGATAIREALSRLVSDGLVQFEDQRGFLVAPISRADLVDLTEARVDLESMMLLRAIERGDTAWEADVLASYHRLSKCPPPLTTEAARVWSGVHQAFHETLLAGCGSRWLRSLCRLLYDKSERYRHLANLRLSSQSTPREDEHRHLMEAALDRQSALACSLLAAHFRQTTALMLQASEAHALFEPVGPARGRPRSVVRATPEPGDGQPRTD